MEPINGTEHRQEDDRLQALTDFYKAFNGRDIGATRRSWSGRPEISMSNPVGALRRGWPEIEAVYRRLFQGEASVCVEFYDYTIFGDDSFFVAVGRERGRANRQAVHVDLAIRTSRLFVREADMWRLLHHHGSMDNPALLEQYQRVILG